MANLEIKALVEILLKGANLPDDVKAKLRALGTEAEATGKKLSVLERVQNSLKNVFGSTLGAIIPLTTAVLAARKAWEAFTEFAKTERQWAGIATQIRGLGDATGAMAAQAREGINKLADATGFIDDDMIPAFGKLLRATNDVQTAQGLLRVSAIQAANGVGTLESNADALANALLTGTTRGLKEFGVKTGDAAKGGETLTEAIEHILKATNAMNPSLDDAQHKVDTLRQKFDAASDAIANATNKTIDFLIEQGKLMQLGGSKPGDLEKLQALAAGKAGGGDFGGVQSGTAERRAKADQAAQDEAARKAFAARQAAIDKAAADAAAKAVDEATVKIQKAVAERLATAQDAAQSEVEAVKQAQAKLVALRLEGARKGTHEELEARLNAIDAAYDAERSKAAGNQKLIDTLNLQQIAARANETEKFNAEVAATALSQAQELTQAKIGLEEQALNTDHGNQVAHLDELGRLQQDLLKLQMQAEIDGAEQTGKDVEKIKTTYALLAKQSELAINQEKIDAETAQEMRAAQAALEATQANTVARYRAQKALLDKEWDDRIKAARKGSKEELDLQKGKENAQRSLQTQTVANQISLYAGAANQLNSQLIKTFGEHKAFAIAQAIIDTAGAVANAYNSGIPAPGNIILAAAIGALGAIQIAKIASTNIGSTSAPSTGGGASVSGGGGGGGRHSRPSGERPPQSGPLTTDRYSGSTATPAERAVRRADETRFGARDKTAAVVHNDNRTSTFAPETHVHLEGVVATTHTQVMKDLHRGLATVERTVIKRSRVNG